MFLGEHDCFNERFDPFEWSLEEFFRVFRLGDRSFSLLPEGFLDVFRVVEIFRLLLVGIESMLSFKDAFLGFECDWFILVEGFTTILRDLGVRLDLSVVRSVVLYE